MPLCVTLQRSDAELVRRFNALSSEDDVADLLEVPVLQLRYILYKGRHRYPYSTFTIPKRRGGTRTIHRPPRSLAILQRKLAYILNLVYRPRTCVHGFVRERSIVTNARVHVGQCFVLNIDLEDFFHSINFGRVRGMLTSKPFGVGRTAATILAHLACESKRLPQGAPSSPVISNMICMRLDSEFTRFARSHRCRYSRYADDITFSSSRSRPPSALVSADGCFKSCPTTESITRDRNGRDPSVTLGNELLSIFRSNGFAVNGGKVRLQHRSSRQEVTGIVVNELPNPYRRHLRQIRAMTHALATHDVASCASEFSAKYDARHRPTSGTLFRQVLLGKLEFVRMVKGENDRSYRNLVNRLSAVMPSWIQPIAIDSPPTIDRDWEFWREALSSKVYHLEITKSNGDITSGSGFRVANDRIITAAHNNVGEITVLVPGGSPLPIKAVNVHPNWQSDGVDIACLEVDLPDSSNSQYPAFRTGKLAAGMQVAALGFPAVPLRHPEFSICPGFLESTLLTYSGSLYTHSVSMQLAGGMSGGPVIDRGGRVIGLVMEQTIEENSTAAPRRFTQVLPISYAADLLA